MDPAAAPSNTSTKALSLRACCVSVSNLSALDGRERSASIVVEERELPCCLLHYYPEPRMSYFIGFPVLRGGHCQSMLYFRELFVRDVLCWK